ncbi:MAG: ribosome recycling factor [Bacteroidota bacterium]
MNEKSKICLDEAKEGMEHAVIHLEKELHKIRAGKADPTMLDGVRIDYYGTMTPIDQLANINTPDPRQIVVQPYDKKMLQIIEKAIMNSNLGLNPQNNGEILRINIPPLSEDRRKEMVKRAKAEAETAKVSIRNIRRIAMEAAKKLEKDGLPEDETKVLEKEIQDFTNSSSDKVEKILVVKEKDIMTV